MLGLAKEAVLFGGTSLLARLLPLLSGKVSPIFDASDLSSMYQSSTGGTAVAAHADPCGLQFVVPPTGTSVGAYIASQAELLSSGTVQLIGSATAATYNTSTGVGTATRVDSSNQSYVRLVATASQMTRTVITNTGSATLSVKTGTGAGTTITTVAASASAEILGLADASGYVSVAPTSNSTSIAFTVTSFKAVPLLYRLQATGTKRPLYDTSTGKPGLKYDGTDDCLVTPSIDYSGGDSITVCAAVRKLSDAAQGTILELSATISANNGTVLMRAPQTPANTDYAFFSKGTGLAGAIPSAGIAPAPVSSVLTGLADISSDTCLLRMNGAQVASDMADQGTGNYGNYAFNYGARNNGASLAFNGIEFWSLVCPTNDNTILTLAEQIATSKLG